MLFFLSPSSLSSATRDPVFREDRIDRRLAGILRLCFEASIFFSSCRLPHPPARFFHFFWRRWFFSLHFRSRPISSAWADVKVTTWSIQLRSKGRPPQSGILLPLVSIFRSARVATPPPFRSVFGGPGAAWLLFEKWRLSGSSLPADHFVFSPPRLLS